MFFEWSAVLALLLALVVVFITYKLITSPPDVLWLFSSVDTKSNRHGGELVAQVLKAHDVKAVFTLCGGHISPIVAAAEKSSIRVVDTRNEANAVFAADAVARLTGNVGVAAVTAGPGLTNTITALKNAQIAESPVLVLSGAAPGLTRGRGALQDIEQMELVKPLCKFVARASSCRSIVPLLKKAIRIARSGTPGPVMVEFPIDVLYTYETVAEVLRVPQNARSFGLRVVAFYMRMYLKYVFAGAFSSAVDARPEPVHIPRPSSGQLDSLAALLSKAERPVIVMGSQSILPPVSAHQTGDNLKSLGVPVFMAGMSRGLMGPRHKCAFRHARKAALKEADLIVLAGVVCDFRLDYGRSLNSRAKVIAINRCKKQLFLNSDLFWRPTLAINADVGTTIDQLAARMRDQGAQKMSPRWLATLQQREDARDKEIEQKATLSTALHNNPLSVLKCLEEKGLDDNAILVVDGGDFVGSASYILRPRGPLSWLDPGAFGTLGVGAGFALGAKICRPDATVWVIYGDGSCAYSIAEWDTMHRHQLPAIAVIGNDACWSQIRRDQVKLLSTDVACGLAYTPYHKIGANYAAQVNGEQDTEVGGFLVDRDSLPRLPGMLTEAKRLNSQGAPAVLNCLIGSTDFREGSISC